MLLLIDSYSWDEAARIVDRQLADSSEEKLLLWLVSPYAVLLLDAGLWTLMNIEIEIHILEHQSPPGPAQRLLTEATQIASLLLSIPIHIMGERGI